MNRLHFFAFALFLSCSLICVAQVNNMYLGPEGGPGLGILYGSNSAKQNRVPLAGGTAGYAFQYNFTKIFSIRTDVSYERTGAGYNINFPPGNQNGFDKFDYMNLPILARATFGKKLGFFADAGPCFGLLLREVTQYKDSYAGVVTESSTNNTSALRRFDTGITEGLGLMFSFGSSYAISFEARNNTGLYNVWKKYPNGTLVSKTDTTNFIFAFIYKLVTAKHPHNKQPTQKA